MADAAETLRYIAVDDLPEVAAGRQEVREQAWDMIRLRREQIAARELEHVPLPIDVLSTAQKVLEAEEQQDSERRKLLFSGLQLDCLRLVAEWVRKNKPEYFPITHHHYDATTEEFYSHGLSTRQMTENALTPIKDDPEEEHRRVNERVEDATHQIIKKVGGLALRVTKVRTFSECTDKAIRDYHHDQIISAPHRGYNGYVPEIEKVMIRDISFDEISEDRLEEQIGLPGIYINHYVIKKAILERGVNVLPKNKTELHGTQLLVKDDLIDFVELLDRVASEEWCVPIFMGEVVPSDHPKDYGSIRAEARERQDGLKAKSNLVALFVMDLAANQTDPRKAPAIVEEFVKKLLLNMAREDLSLAVHMFDERTAKGLSQVAYLESMGLQREAAELLQRVETNAPGGGYCGAGSCGLEAVMAGSKDEEDLAKLGFNRKDTIKDTERKCKCGSKTVFYDLKQAKKGCTSCGKTAKY